MFANLRRISVIEAISYLALLVATILKNTGRDDIGVTILGPVHGVLYLVFVAMVLWRRDDLGWDVVRTVLALFIGALPFGGFWLERNWLSVSEVGP